MIDVVLAVGLAGGGYRVAELGADDPVSQGERAALATLAAWADRRVRLDGDPEPPDI